MDGWDFFFCCCVYSCLQLGVHVKKKKFQLYGVDNFEREYTKDKKQTAHTLKEYTHTEKKKDLCPNS